MIPALCISLVGGIIFIRGREWKLSASILVIALIPVSIFVGTLYSNTNHDQNIYQSMTLGAMPSTKNPGWTLADINI